MASTKSQLQRSPYMVLKKDQENSYATRHDRMQMLRHIADELVGQGYKISNIRQLQQKHVVKLTKHWQAKSLSNSTIKNRLSALRRLAVLMGNPDCIPSNQVLQVGSRPPMGQINRAIHNPDVSQITDLMFAFL